MAVDLQKLKRKMKGVTNTCQVTRALQMVSAMKMRKAQEMSIKSRDYHQTLQAILATFDMPVWKAVPELAATPSGYNVLVVTFASDRGLCGPFNSNIIGSVQKLADEVGPSNLKIRSIGWKVGATLKRRGYNVISNTRHPAINDRLLFLHKISHQLWDDWKSGQYRAVRLIYSTLKGMTVQKPTFVEWLPLITHKPAKTPRHIVPPTIDFIDEPDSREVLAAAIQRLLQNQILSALLETTASDHVARMIAMDNATRNAEEMLSSLRLTYNKARQFKITQEICEIVAGANAING
jgi:F-type H+-transporting ATPase subunit gamma